MLTMEDKETNLEEIALLDERDRQAENASSALRVEIVRDTSSFAALRTEWAELLDKSEAGVFNSWEWLYSWHRRIGHEYSLYIFTARNGQGKLVGVMPLCMEQRRALGHTVRRLAFLGETEVCGDFLDMVAQPEQHAEVVRAFAAFLQEEQGAWDVLDLADIDSQSPTVALLQSSFAGPSYKTELRPGEVCPRITFAEDATFDSFIRLSGRRENYMRRRKWLEKQPGFSIDRAEDPVSLAVPFSEFLRLHSLRWAEDGGSDGIRGPEVEAFHRDATLLLAERKKLQLFTMRIEGKAVATLYGLRHGDTFSYYQAGRDPDWNSKSVGMVLLAETFKMCIESGVIVYDFLRGEEAYKMDWSNNERHLVGLRILSHGGSGKWLEREEDLSKSARQVAERLMSPALKERVKQTLRHK